MANSFENAAGRAGDSIERNISRGAVRAGLSLERQTNRVADAQDRVNRLRAEYSNIATRSDVDDNKIIKVKEKQADAERALARAMRDRGLAQRNVSSLTDEAVDGLKKIDRSAKDAAGSLGQLGKNSFSVGRGGLIAGLLPLVPTLIDTAKVAVTATQSLYLLPAAITAAGTAFGTLKLATMGFGDALDNIKDPEKFAEALATLSPNAQQAALSIRQLLPQLEGLKNATQDSFSAGLGDEFERVSSVYLPQIEKLTTGVASTFNQMIKNIGNQFLTPDMQANFGVIGTNITQMFQNLVPAATSISQAFVDITATGSSFLPGLAKDISDTAAKFANFISEARQSGQLAEWIREGIDAVKLLGDAIWTLGDFIYDTFGANGQQNINDFKDTLSGVQSVLNALSGDFGTFNDNLNNDEGWTLGADIREELDKMTGVAAKFRDAMYNIPESFRALSNSAIDMANTFTDAINRGPIAAINSLIGGSTKLYNVMNNITGGEDRPEDFGKIGNIPKIDRLPDEPYKPWNTLPENTPGGGYSNDRYSGPTDPGQVKPKEWKDPRTGEILVPGPAGVGGWVPKGSVPQPGTPGGPYDVPAPPPTDANGKKLSESDLKRIAREGLDPSTYKVDPFAAIGGMPAPGSLGQIPGMSGGTAGLTLGQMLAGAGGAGVSGPMPAGGYSAANSVDVYEQQHEVISRAHDLEESNKELLAAQKDGVSTAEDIQKAKWKQQEDEFALWKAQQDLVEKMRGTTKNAKNGTEQLGVALDPDLGLGQGLSGFAENITRMFGNIIARPFMEQMQAQINADPIKGGFGLLGINGAKNIAAGTSPLLGRGYGGAAGMPGVSDVHGASGGAFPGPTAGFVPNGATMPSILKDTGSVASGPQSRAAAALIQEQFGSQIRGQIGGSRDNNTAKNTHDAGLSIDIPIGADQMALGDQIRDYLQTNAQALGLKYTIWRDEGRYPDGGTGKPGFTTPGHQNHIDAHFDGQGGVPGAPVTGASGYGGGGVGGMDLASMSAAGVTPVFVVNMGGGMGGGGIAGLFGGGASGAQPAGPGAEGWRQTVEATVAKYGPAAGIPQQQYGKWVDAIVSQIDTESKGNPNAQNNSDSNGKGGKQSVSGLLQYLPSSYANSGGKLTGLPMMDPVGQIAGALAAPRNADGSPNTGATGGIGAGHGWGPAGLPSLDNFTGGGGEGPIFKKAPEMGPPGAQPTSTPGVFYDPASKSFVNAQGDYVNPATGNPYSLPSQGGSGMQVVPGSTNPTQYRTDAGIATQPSLFGPGAAGPGMAPGGAPGLIGGAGAGPAGLPPGSAPGGLFGPTPMGGVQPNIGPAPLQPGAPTATPAAYGGVTPGVAMGGTGGVGITDGGTIDTAIQAAASAVPGLGQAAATGMKLANRAIQYGGQLAGIGVSGLMETFLPTGGSELANSGWIPRIVGGLAGAKPALPNTAGQPGGKEAPPPLTPQQAMAQHLGNGQGPGPGNQVNVEYNSVGQTEDRNGADLAHHLGNLQTGGMAGKP